MYNCVEESGGLQQRSMFKKKKHKNLVVHTNSGFLGCTCREYCCFRTVFGHRTNVRI